jgi:hypothetical protein
MMVATRRHFFLFLEKLSVVNNALIHLSLGNRKRKELHWVEQKKSVPILFFCTAQHVEKKDKQQNYKGYRERITRPNVT